MKTTVEILTGVRELLADPAHWTKGVLARNADDFEVEPRDPRAACWCLAGAVTKVAGDYIVIPILDDVAMKHGAVESDNCPFVELNDADETTHEEILKVLDEAIEISRAYA